MGEHVEDRKMFQHFFVASSERKLYPPDVTTQNPEDAHIKIRLPIK